MSDAWSHQRQLSMFPELDPMAANLEHQATGHPDDVGRLARQLRDVHRAMSDGKWHTLAALAHTTRHPEASISARLRDLRKADFGAHTIERRRHPNGQHIYRLRVEL